MNQKIATIALAIAALAVVFAFLFFPGPEAPTVPPDQAAKAAASETAYSSDFGSGVGVPPPTAGSVPEPPTAPQVAAWEDRLDELLTAKTDNAITVRGLISSMRGLPPEAQEEFVAHAVNLCEDEQFADMEKVYFDPGTAKEASETIFNDALNRPDEIKLPMLAKTLRNPAHPMAAESKEILEMYLDLEPGTVPPNGWDQAVNDYIKQQDAP